MGARKPKTSAAAESFGERLKRLRRERGLTQAELAERLGISRRNYIYYEAQGGGPSPELLTKLTAALRVSGDQLLGREKAPAAGPRIAQGNLRLWRRLKRIEELPLHDRKTILKMIETMADARRKAS